MCKIDNCNPPSNRVVKEEELTEPIFETRSMTYDSMTMI
jgi:hypothetical protein